MDLDTRQRFQLNAHLRVRELRDAPPSWTAPPFPAADVEDMGCGFLFFFSVVTFLGATLTTFSQQEVQLLPGWAGVIGWVLLGIPILVMVITVLKISIRGEPEEASFLGDSMTRIYTTALYLGPLARSLIRHIIGRIRGQTRERLVERLLSAPVTLIWEPDEERLTWTASEAGEVLEERTVAHKTRPFKETLEPGSLSFRGGVQSALARTRDGDARLELWSPESGDRLVIALASTTSKSARVIERPYLEPGEERARLQALLATLLEVYGAEEVVLEAIRT